MNQKKNNDALSAAMDFAKLAGAKQKNFQIEDADGSKHMVTIDKWKVTEQLQFLPTFGMLFSPIIEKFTNVMFTSGRSHIPDEDDQTISGADLLSANSVFMFFQFLATEGNMDTILNDMILKNVSVSGKPATLDSFEDIDQVLLVSVEVLTFNYSRLLSGKGFTGFLNASTAISKFQQE